MIQEAKTALKKLAYSYSENSDDPYSSDLELNEPDCDCETHSQCCLEGDLLGELYLADKPGLDILVKSGFAEDRGYAYEVSEGSIFRCTEAGKAEHERLVKAKEISPLRCF